MLGMLISDGSPAATAISGVFSAAIGAAAACGLFYKSAKGRIFDDNMQLLPGGLSYGYGSAIGFLPALGIPVVPVLGASPTTLGVLCLGSALVAMFANLTHNAKTKELAGVND
jgi:hypothetical protein